MVATFDIDRARAAFAEALNVEEDWFRQSWPNDAARAQDVVGRQVLNAERINCPAAVFRTFCTNSQNKSGSAHLVPDENWTRLGREVFFNFDYVRIAETYPWNGNLSQLLCNRVLEAHNADGPILHGNVQRHAESLRDPNRPRSAWRKLLTTVQSGATLFTRRAVHEPGRDAFERLIGRIAAVELQHLTSDMVWNAAEPFTKVPYVGQPLAQNFLKDIGLPQFFKPDVHTRRVAGLAFRNPSEQFPNNGGVRRTLDNALAFAQAADQWPAAVDRMMWLAGSGRFYQLQPERLLPKAQSDERIRHIASILRCSVTTLDNDP